MDNKEKEEVQKIIDKSGNNFHCKVTRFLRGKDWSTMVSPYYMDANSNKPREIDLIAEKQYSIHSGFESSMKAVNIKLFIECKFIPNKVVFWFDEKDHVSAEKWATDNTPLRENKIYTNQHHYLSSNKQVAKLFSGESDKNFENEPIYKALNQSLNAMIYNRNSPGIIHKQRDPDETIELPVILCNSFEKFYKVEMDSQGSPESIDSNFLLEVNYAYTNLENSNVNEFFLIDVVDYNKLDQFLSTIDTEARLILETMPY